MIADCGKILYSVLIQFSNTIMETYQRCVTTIFPIFVPWLTDHDNLPQYPDGEAWGYATNRAVAIQQLKLRQRYVEAVIQRGCPLPELKKCHPYITTGWNKTKIRIDGPCKFLSDAAPVHKKCSAPKLFFLETLGTGLTMQWQFGGC